MNVDAEHPEPESREDETLARHKRMAEVLDGKRPMDWSDWATFIYDSKRLTPDGQCVALWAVDTLQRTLGANFLQQAAAASVRHPIFSHLWPANDVPWVYANLFQLAAQIELVQPSAGWSLVRDAMRRDLRFESWVHSCLQLEMASLALKAGWQVVLEPGHSTGKRADVLLAKEATELLVETKSMQISGKEREADAFFHRMVWKLLDLAWKHTVRITGSIGSSLSPKAEACWLQAIEKAVRETTQEGTTRVVLGPVQGRLEISRDATMLGVAELEGVLVETNVGKRLIDQLGRKNEQAAGSEPVWVRLDEYAGLWQFTSLQRITLPEKLDALTPFLQNALAFFPNLAGVMLSPALLWASDIPPESLSRRTERNGGIAVSCPIPGHRVRESTIITQAGQRNEHAGIFADWYEREAIWLDWALARLGHPPFDTLVHLGKSNL